MARSPVADDGSPIVIGDSSSQLRGTYLRQFISDPHISLQHKCFHELLVGGISIQNSGFIAESVKVLGGNSYRLAPPWVLDLNGGLIGGVRLLSTDSLTILIQHVGEYDLVAVPVPAANNIPLSALNTLIIGTADLSSAKLDGTEILGNHHGLSIIWAKIL